ncbi:SAM-dependent methyltransferase [Acrocarpospora corrugata]|nr:SAM-dependent methyltransferase [Acrocarpospora corrugata]
MHDYYLGGKDNTLIDRACADEVLRRVPLTRETAWANRRFAARAIAFLAGERGIRQFLDVGVGLPSRDNTHEMARRAGPDARVIYADNDPVVLAHARALLARDPRTRAIAGDIRKPGDLLADEQVRDLFDLSQPVAVLLTSLLHHLPDSAEPHQAVAALMAGLPPGSCLVISHARREPSLLPLEFIYERASAPAVPRSPAAIAEFFAGLTLAEPGLVGVRRWRPDELTLPCDPDVPMLGAVGVKT